MKKEVLIYLVYAFIGMFLVVMIFFGEGRITSFAIFNERGMENENQAQRAIIEKEVLLSKEEGDFYVSEVLDSGAESRIRDIELNEDELETEGRLLYGFAENGELLVSSNEGLNWDVVQDPVKIEKMKSAVTKSDLIETNYNDVLIEVRACLEEDCNDGEFVDVNDAEDLKGRYFQYRLRIGNSDRLENFDSISAKVSYETIILGSQINEEVNSETNIDRGIANNG